MVPYISFILVLFALALLLRVDLLLTVVWLLVAVYVISRFWIRRAALDVHVRRRFDTRAFVGDFLRVQLEVSNGGHWPIPWLELEESLPADLRGNGFPSLVVGLRGHASREVEYTLVCRQRGYYTLGPARLALGDLVGLEDRRLVKSEPTCLVVYPRVVPLHKLGLPTLSALATFPAPLSLFLDPSRIVGVRDYATGDTSRQIHWKASARVGRLVVKQYQPATARETLICLNLSLQGYPVRSYEAVEEAIVVAASLAHHIALRDSLPVGLATQGEDPVLRTSGQVCILPRRERSHLMSVLELLARIQSIPAMQFPELLRAASTRLSPGSTMVIITGAIDHALGSMALHLQRSGHAVGIVLVQPAALLPQPGEAGSMSRIPVHRVWTDLDLAVGL